VREGGCDDSAGAPDHTPGTPPGIPHEQPAFALEHPPAEAPDPHAALVRQVFDSFSRLVRAVTRDQMRGPRDCASNLDLIRAATVRQRGGGALTADDWGHALRGIARACERPGQWQWLTLTHLCRERNLQRYMCGPYSSQYWLGNAHPDEDDIPF